MSSTKRILNIEVKRIDDNDGDTSWLGEYSNSPSGDYSIDRKHSLDCASVNPVNDETVNKLERSISYLMVQRNAVSGNYDLDHEFSKRYDAVNDAIDLIVTAQEAITECDCDEDGDMSRGEYRYFNTSGNYKGEPIEDIRKYTIQDYKRMESLNAGNWSFIGIRAEAEINVNGTVQTITSGGLYGIESDSDESYFKEVEAEQISELRDTLHEMGFSKRAIATSVKEFVG